MQALYLGRLQAHQRIPRGAAQASHRFRRQHRATVETVSIVHQNNIDIGFKVTDGAVDLKKDRFITLPRIDANNIEDFIYG